MKKFTLVFIVLFLLAPVGFSSAQYSCESGQPTSSLCNALPSLPGLGGSRTPINSIEGLFGAVFVFAGTIASFVLLAMILYSAARMIVSRGDPQAISSAKASLLYSISGFLVILFGYVIISMIQYFIGVNTSEPDNSFFFNPLNDFQLWNLNPDTNSDGEALGSSFIATMFIRFVTFIGTIAMLFIILNGFRYMLARDNEEQIRKSKDGLTWSIIGLILAILSYTIVRVIIDTIN